MRKWTLTIAPADRDEVAKTGVSDETVIVDSPAWLAPALGVLRARRAAQDMLFDINDKKMKKVWEAACARLRIRADRYQLRHSGASSDSLSRSRTPEEVMARGRWTTLKSVKRYAKGGALQKMLSRLPREVRHFCQEAEANLEDLLTGRRKPLVPAFDHLPVVNVVR